MILAVMTTTRRAPGPSGHPLPDVAHVATVATALAPDEQPSHHAVAHRTRCRRGPTHLAPPRPSRLEQRLPAPGAVGVDHGGLLVQAVHPGQGTQAQHLDTERTNMSFLAGCCRVLGQLN